MKKGRLLDGRYSQAQASTRVRQHVTRGGINWVTAENKRWGKVKRKEMREQWEEQMEPGEQEKKKKKKKTKKR